MSYKKRQSNATLATAAKNPPPETREHTMNNQQSEGEKTKKGKRVSIDVSPSAKNKDDKAEVEIENDSQGLNAKGKNSPSRIRNNFEVSAV